MNAILIHENKVLGQIMTDRQLSVAEAAALLDIDITAEAGGDPLYNIEAMTVIMVADTQYIAVMYYNEIGDTTTYRGVISDSPILPGNKEAPHGDFTPLCWSERQARGFLRALLLECGMPAEMAETAPKVFGGL